MQEFRAAKYPRLEVSADGFPEFKDQSEVLLLGSAGEHMLASTNILNNAHHNNSTPTYAPKSW